MLDADPMAIAGLPDEAGFRARLRQSGRLVDGQLDLAIDLDGLLIGRIQTFVPPGRPLPPGTFDVGIGLREHARGRGYGREALALLTGWLFEHAGAEVIEGATDPANVAMRTVFQRSGWHLVRARDRARHVPWTCTGSPGTTGSRGPAGPRRAANAGRTAGPRSTRPTPC